MQNNRKLYSHRSITIAIFFGGPIAAGYLARQNYLNLNEPQKASNAMLLGIFYTVLVIIGLVLLPDELADKNINMVVYFFNVLLIYLVVEATQGKALKNHKRIGGEFYSAWNAVGVGFLCMIILLAVMIISLFIMGDLNFEYNNINERTYRKEIQKFAVNEEKALDIFAENSESTDTTHLVQEINKGLSLWEKNKVIVNNLNKDKTFPQEILERNEILLQYCDLRIKQYTLLRKSLLEKTQEPIFEAQQVENEINKLLQEKIGIELK